jgi:hypothetical protein
MTPEVHVLADAPVPVNERGPSTFNVPPATAKVTIELWSVVSAKDRLALEFRVNEPLRTPPLTDSDALRTIFEPALEQIQSVLPGTTWVFQLAAVAKSPPDGPVQVAVQDGVASAIPWKISRPSVERKATPAIPSTKPIRERGHLASANGVVGANGRLVSDPVHQYAGIFVPAPAN